MSTKTIRAMRLAAAGMTCGQIAAAIGSGRESVKKLLWRARNPELARERLKKARKGKVRRPEQRARASYVDKCRRAGVQPEPLS